MANERRNPTGVVQGGGFWNTQPVQISRDTQQLLKNMMEESKLTNFQQRTLSSKLQKGEVLPVNCNPTTSAKRRTQAPPQPKNPKVLNPRNYRSGMRTRDMIEESGAYEKNEFKPAPVRGRSDKDKERLANLMAYGEDLPPPTGKRLASRRKTDDDSDDEFEEPMDRFNELIKEVEERREFLDKMISVGQGKKYQPIIETEISQLVREMEIIDKKKTKELEAAMAAQKGNR